MWPIYGVARTTVCIILSLEKHARSSQRHRRLLFGYRRLRNGLKRAAVVRLTIGSKGGWPGYDVVLMFKVLILQTLYTLSDDATVHVLSGDRTGRRRSRRQRRFGLIANISPKPA